MVGGKRLPGHRLHDRKDVLYAVVEFRNEHRLLRLGALAVGDLGQREYAADAAARLIAKRTGAKQEMFLMQPRQTNLCLRATKRVSLQHELQHLARRHPDSGMVRLRGQLHFHRNGIRQQLPLQRLVQQSLRGEARLGDASVSIADDDRLGRLLENGAREPLRSREFFGMLLGREIGNDQKQRRSLVESKGADPDQRGRRAAVPAPELQFAAGRLFRAVVKQICEARCIFRRNEIRHRFADEVRDRIAEEMSKMAVAVKNPPVLAEGQRALVHPLDHQAIGLLRAGERRNHWSPRTSDDQRVDGALGDRLQRLLGLSQAQAQRLDLRRLYFFGDTLHVYPAVNANGRYTLALTSIPSRVSTRSLFPRSPIMRLMGSGTQRTRVGMAMISSRCAKAGSAMTSTTSSLYRPDKYFSQSPRRFESAAIDFGVCPAM